MCVSLILQELFSYYSENRLSINIIYRWAIYLCFQTLTSRGGNIIQIISLQTQRPFTHLSKRMMFIIQFQYRFKENWPNVGTAEGMKNFLKNACISIAWAIMRNYRVHNFSSKIILQVFVIANHPLKFFWWKWDSYLIYQV